MRATKPEGRPAAIVDFIVNLGDECLQTSTLRRHVNLPDWASAATELGCRVYGRGKELPGLMVHQTAEANLLLVNT